MYEFKTDALKITITITIITEDQYNNAYHNEVVESRIIDSVIQFLLKDLNFEW